MIVDAHLDLAHNVLDLGRDLTLPLAELRRLDSHTDIPVVTLPALRDAGVALCFATVWVDPAQFPDTQSAYQHAVRQIEVYQRWEDSGYARIVRSKGTLERHLSHWQNDKIPGLVILIEGADCIREPSEVEFWKSQGARLIGPAWKKTRYCGGTGEPGGLTELGHELLQAMSEANMALDFAHMDEQAFWESLEVFGGPVCATHANPRHFIPTNRHLSDAMLEAIKQRNGMVGVVLYNSFLKEGWKRGDERVRLTVVSQHLKYLANLLGWDRVGIGSDFDGGFGLNENPAGLDEPSDLRKLANWVPVDSREDVLNANWLRWLRTWL